MKIIGLDIGRGSAVLCCLDELPANIKKYYKNLKNSKGFLKLPTTKHGLEKFLALKPDGIVLEPTGHWYSHFWVTAARANNIKVYWLGHCDLDSQRKYYGFPNKRDEEDALCLAASYFDNRLMNEQGHKRFLNHYYDQDKIVEIRELFLQKEQLQKLRTGLIAQLRQRLAYEFPEAHKQKLTISVIRGFTPIIGWLADIHADTRAENKYKLSVVHDLGIEISDYTRSHSKAIIDLELRLGKHYDFLVAAIDREEFKPYLRVFNRFGFGLDNQVLLLYHCYPFEKFLVDGKPWVERELTDNNKWQKRDRSLRKFQAFMGLSFKYRQSGDKKSRKFHGSSLIRSHLYIWAVCMVAPQKNGYKIDGKIGQELSDRYQELRGNVKGKDSLMRILFKVTRMLYYELLSEIIS